MNTRPTANLNLEALREAQAKGRFAEFLRKPKKLESVTGYLLEASQDCLVVKSLNWDSFCWNGKIIVWTDTVKHIHSFAESEWPIVAARRFNLTQKVVPRIVNQPLQLVLERVLPLGQMILLEQELRLPNQLFLCKILAFSGKGMRVKSFDCSLRGVEELTIPYAQATKITVGDAYSVAASAALESSFFEAQRGVGETRQSAFGHGPNP